MASVSQLNQFSCKKLISIRPHHKISSNPSILPPNSIKPVQNSIKKAQFLIQNSVLGKPIFVVRAAEDDELIATSGVAVAGEEKPPKEASKIDSLKKALVDSFYGTDLGLRASSETGAEIVEHITQLETKNPTPAPTEALPLLNGRWILA